MCISCLLQPTGWLGFKAHHCLKNRGMNFIAKSSVTWRGFYVSSITNTIVRKAVWPDIQQKATKFSFLWRWDTCNRILKTRQWSVSSKIATLWGLQPSCMINVITPVYPVNYKCSYGKILQSQFLQKSQGNISFGPIRESCSTSPEVQNTFAYYTELSRCLPFLPEDRDWSCPWNIVF
jgi:hypothetical protein